MYFRGLTKTDLYKNDLSCQQKVSRATDQTHTELSGKWVWVSKVTP